jgi:hypothetical protein
MSTYQKSCSPEETTSLISMKDEQFIQSELHTSNMVSQDLLQQKAATKMDRMTRI